MRFQEDLWKAENYSGCKREQPPRALINIACFNYGLSGSLHFYELVRTKRLSWLGT